MHRWILLIALLAAGLIGLALTLGQGPDPIEQRPVGITPNAGQPREEPEGRQPTQLTQAHVNNRVDASEAERKPLRVQVVNAEGTPQPFAQVHFLDRVRNEDWQLQWENAPERETFLLRHGQTQNATDQGIVQFPGTKDGALFATAAGLTGFLEWSSAPTEDPLILVLREDTNLLVKVVDNRDRPQPGVRIAIVREVEGQVVPMLVRQTGPGGKATFSLVRRVLSGNIQGNPKFYLTFAFPCVDPPKELLDPDHLPTREVRLVMPEVGSLEVKVIDERGLPLNEVANASLGRLVTVPGGKRVFQPDHNERLIGGRAHFTHVGVGARVAIKLSGSRERADLIEEIDGPTRHGEVHRVSVRWKDKYPVLLGTAVSETGEVLSGYRGRYTVWAADRGSGGPPLTTENDGTFRLVIASELDSSPGRYAELELYARDGNEPRYARLDLSGELAPGDTSLGAITFQTKPKLVTGVVRNPAGEGMTGVHVRVRVGDGADRRSTQLNATTLQGGEFTIYGVLEEQFGLVAVRRGYKSGELKGLQPGAMGVELTLMPDFPQGGDRR
ncbi:MAG: carboxypeptidase-like regulatory domain-containing protein [Planctomycetota bacterium]|nr:carboxypeptidase-like regulatory domain-containing protein [Planctomycetota bacterium]